MVAYSRIALDSVILLALLFPPTVCAFQGVYASRQTLSSPLQATTGGWGIGPSKEMKDEEFSNVAKRRRRRGDSSSSSEEVASYGVSLHWLHSICIYFSYIPIWFIIVSLENRYGENV